MGAPVFTLVQRGQDSNLRPLGYERRKLGIEEGGVVAFIETEDGVLLSPRQVLVMDALGRIGEVLREQGLSLEELIESKGDQRPNG